MRLPARCPVRDLLNRRRDGTAPAAGDDGAPPLGDHPRGVVDSGVAVVGLQCLCTSLVPLAGRVLASQGELCRAPLSDPGPTPSCTRRVLPEAPAPLLTPSPAGRSSLRALMRWHLHDLAPEFELPPRKLAYTRHLHRLADWLDQQPGRLRDQLHELVVQPGQELLIGRHQLSASGQQQTDPYRGVVEMA